MPKIDKNEQARLAHGFNEELTIILNTASVTLEMFGPDHPAAAAMTDLHHSAVRCAALARALEALRDAAGLTRRDAVR